MTEKEVIKAKDFLELELESMEWSEPNIDKWAQVLIVMKALFEYVVVIIIPFGLLGKLFPVSFWRVFANIRWYLRLLTLVYLIIEDIVNIAKNRHKGDFRSEEFVSKSIEKYSGI